MEQRKLIAVIIGVSVIVGLSTLTLLGLQSETTGLRWSLSEGDDIYLNITTYAQNLQNATFEIENPESFIALNNTVIRIKILELPQIPHFVVVNIFVEEVIGEANISMAFTNGSNLPDEPSIYLSDLFTSTILPVGNWNLIDELFQNEDPNPPFMQSWYFSRLFESHMEFGYTLYGPDYANGWKANVSLDTGIPFAAEYWSINAVEEFSYHLIFTLNITS